MRQKIEIQIYLSQFYFNIFRFLKFPFELNPVHSAILSDTAFGHVGAGGSIGFADPAKGLSFGYAMNRMGAGLLLNERGQSLVDAANESIMHLNS